MFYKTEGRCKGAGACAHVCEQAYGTAFVGTNTHTHTLRHKNTRREAAAIQKVVPQWDVRWDEESTGLWQGLGKSDLHHWAAGVETILL